MQEKSDVNLQAFRSEDEEGGKQRTVRLLPFRQLFFLTLVFLYVPFAYTNGVKLHSISFVDLSSFYCAAQTTFRLHQSPYAPGALAWGVQATHDPVWPYLYPPPTLLLFSPFAHMSYGTAKLLVLAANHLCVLGLLFLLLHLLGLTAFLRPQAAREEQNGQDRRKEWLVLFLMVYLFLFQPIVQTLLAGQINLYVILLLCLMWYALKKNASPSLCALPFALAIVLKTYPLMFLPVLLLRGRWQVASWTLGFLTLLAALSYLVLPHALWHDWLTFVVPYGGYTKTVPGLFSPSSVWNQSVNGFASRLFVDPQTAVQVMPGAAKVLAYSLCAALFGAEMLLTWRHQAAQKTDQAAQKALRTQGSGFSAKDELAKDGFLDMDFALFLLTIYLVAPLSWEHHLVFVLPAIFVALAHIFSQQESWQKTLWVAAPAFMIAWPIHLDNAGWEAHVAHLFLSLKFYAVLALWLFFATWFAQTSKPK